MARYIAAPPAEVPMSARRSRLRIFVSSRSRIFASWSASDDRARAVRMVKAESPNGIYGMSWCAGLLRLEARELHDLAPLLGFIDDEPAEIGGWTPRGGRPHLGKPRLDPRIGKARIDLLVEPGDDVGGGIRGRDDARPAGRLETRHIIAHRRDIRQQVRACCAGQSQSSQL